MDRLENIKKYIVSGNNIFISGIGGTGKSFLIKQIYEWCKNIMNLCVSLTSTTGISSYNIGGQTIHRWSGLILPSSDVSDPANFIRKCLRKINADKKLKTRWIATNIIIIDEISMCGGTYLHFLNIIAQELRQNYSPFGGIQLIVSGDMLQLPPVKDIFPFQAPIWTELKFINIVLSKAYRFENQNWTDCLQRIRLQKMTSGDIKTLKECAERYLLLNKDENDQKIIHFEIRQGTENTKDPLINSSDTIIKKIKPTIILPTNEQVDKVNIEELNKIKGDVYTYYSIDTCGFSKDTDEIDYTLFKKCNPEEVEFIDKEIIIPSKLQLKPGAQVMLLLNLDVELGLTNGTRGVVLRCDDKSVHVEFENISNPLKIEYEKCHNVEDFEGKIYSRRMIPLKLATSISVHKCCDENTLIYTDKGLKPIKKIANELITNLENNTTYKCSFNVMTKNGFSEFTQIHKGIIEDTYKIKTEFGYEISGSQKHPILTFSFENNTIKEVWKKCPDININDYIVLKNKCYCEGLEISTDNFIKNYKFNNNSKIYRIPATINKNICYLIGLLIGDGCYSIKTDYPLEFCCYKILI